MSTITCANCSNPAAHTYKSRNIKNGINYCFKCLPEHMKKVVRSYSEAYPLDVPVEEAPKASKKKAKSVEEAPVVEETPVVEEAPVVDEAPVTDENNQD